MACMHIEGGKEGREGRELWLDWLAGRMGIDGQAMRQRSPNCVGGISSSERPGGKPRLGEEREGAFDQVSAAAAAAATTISYLTVCLNFS